MALFISQLFTIRGTMNNRNPIIKLLITYFLGLFGVHKFMDGKTKQGIIYICTLGLFGIGWLYDVVLAIIDVVHYYKTGNTVFDNYTHADIVIPDMPYKSPSGGYMNYAQFKVVGINPATKRKNTRQYNCRTEQDAEHLAKAEGLVDLDISIIPFAPPSEAQYAACRKHNRKIPPGACLMDVSALMTRDIEKQKPASIELLQYADEMGLKISYLSGEESIRELFQ